MFAALVFLQILSTDDEIKFPSQNSTLNMAWFKWSHIYLFSLWLLTEGQEAENVPGIGDGKFNMSGIFVACCCGRVQDDRLLLLNSSPGISKSNNELGFVVLWLGHLLTGDGVSSWMTPGVIMLNISSISPSVPVMMKNSFNFSVEETIGKSYGKPL